MKKMRLSLDDLDVQGFETGGGVVGFDSTEYTPCGACDQPNTGEDFCAEGTYATCAQACTLFYDYTCQQGCVRTQAPANTCFNTCWYGKTVAWGC